MRSREEILNRILLLREEVKIVTLIAKDALKEQNHGEYDRQVTKCDYLEDTITTLRWVLDE